MGERRKFHTKIFVFFTNFQQIVKALNIMKVEAVESVWSDAGGDNKL